MISFAQNFEDVILARALGHITKGSYIDLGAADSTYLSVTKHFYDSGWRGINVEPHPGFFRGLLSNRPDDINLMVGIAAEADTSQLYCATESELSTFDKNLGESYLQEFPGSYVAKVEMITPSALIDLVNQHFREIHFLKIDIEGQEAEVLNNWDFDRLAPWIVLVEATRPRTRKPTHDEWERSLLNAGYQLVYEDGLNRFYLHDRKSELKELFRFPPNLFDGFITYSEFLAIQERNAMLASRSWKMTSPIRALLALPNFFRKSTTRQEN